MGTGFNKDLFRSWLEKGVAMSGLSVTKDQLRLMEAHGDALATWNQKMNLTAITQEKEMAEKHFLDSLLVHSQLAGVERLADFGSGGGFPALPLKIMNPGMEIVMVDSVRKKVSFLNHVVRTLKLDGIRAVHGRVEDLAKETDHKEGYDGVISRGFTELAAFATLARPWLAPDGRIYALKGPGADSEITENLEAAYEIELTGYLLPFEGAKRCLITLAAKGDKV